MTSERARELRELLAKATRNAWEADGSTVGAYGRGIIANCPTPQNGGTMEVVANAELIAAMHTHLPALLDHIDTLEAALSNREAVWQPIETAPKGEDPDETNGPPIIIWEPGWPTGYEGFWYARDQAWFLANLDSEYGEPCYPTHWQPLPTPPANLDREG